MNIGDTFNDSDDQGPTNWIALSVTPDQNQTFKWLKVIAKWSGFGPRPRWANEPRKFYLNRQRIVPVEGLQTYF